jgi:S1-C subfamily serine protease
MEMMRRTRQNGVPVIADEQEAIVGFDVPRLRAMAARHAPAPPSLGVMAKDVAGGAEVGRVRPGSTAERAGIQAGDVIMEMSGQPVASSGDLARIAARRNRDAPTSVRVRRGADDRTLILPPA